jgi:hypothetical protein
MILETTLSTNYLLKNNSKKSFLASFVLFITIIFNGIQDMESYIGIPDRWSYIIFKPLFLIFPTFINGSFGGGI